MKSYACLLPLTPAFVSIRRADYWLVEESAPQAAHQQINARFQSAGRIIGWLKKFTLPTLTILEKFQSAGRIIGWLKKRSGVVRVVNEQFQSAGRIIGWLKNIVTIIHAQIIKFQSAGRIIGWLKMGTFLSMVRRKQFQSAGRIIGWLKLRPRQHLRGIVVVSIRRADYWLVEVSAF